MGMVDCTNCNIAFNASSPRCPLCQDFEPPALERAKSLAAIAEADLDSGASIESVTRSLIQQGLPADFVPQLITLCHSRIARRERAHGLSRLMIGVGSVLLGGLSSCAGMPIAGGFMVIFGMTAIASGALAVLTGRDGGISSNMSPDEFLMLSGFR